VIEQRLRQGKHDVRDEHNSWQLQSILEESGGRIGIGELAPILVAEGFHMVVRLRYEFAAERHTSAFGQRIHFKTARIRLNAYLLRDGSSIGRGWTEAVEYTELSADKVAKKAFLGASGNLVRASRERWIRLKETGR
jgi:hypothetical protein